MSSSYQAHPTLWHRWCRNSEKTPTRDAIVHWVAGQEPFRWTFSGLIEAAETIAASLIEHDVKRDQVCAIILRHCRFLYPLYLACTAVGAIPAILAYPNPRLHPDKFREGLEGMSRRSGLDWILTERDLEPVVRPLVETVASTIRGLQFPLEWDPVGTSSNPSILLDVQAGITGASPLLLQHSSGTTGLQKPVMLSHNAVLQHVTNYGSSLRLSADDKIVSWLPLYHDMGLIAALHVPLAFGITTIQIDPFEWVVVPSLLLQAVSKERATISWLPNFAFSMMADKIHDDDLEGVDLDSWRLVINCSEPVRYEDQQKFLRRFQPYGLNERALATCYATAETTFAVTQSVPYERPTMLAVDKEALAKGNVTPATGAASARLCVSSGQPIPGCEIRIVGEDLTDVGEAIVGEIVIKSTSMFDGYRNYHEKTAAVLREGWYYSGDCGFRRGNDYYVIGRKKDIIIVAGNNIYPEDIEAVVSSVDGVLPGRVIAFGEEDEALGSERLAVMAETSLADEQSQRALRRAIVTAGMSIDVSIASVYLVPPRFLIKSSAGKPSRSANKGRASALTTTAAQSPIAER